MEIVAVAKWVPWPPNSGDKQRTLGVLRGLGRVADVTLCGFTSDAEDPVPLESEGIRVRSVPLARRPVDVVGGLLATRSATAARFFDPRMAREVRRAVADGADVLLVEHVQLLPYARGLRPALLVLDMHNIESALARRIAGASHGPRRIAWWLESRALRGLERRARAADVIAVVSEVDRRTLQTVLRHPRVVVVPNAWDEPAPLPPAPGPVVSFVGIFFWGPNIDAAVWFCREVWPNVLAARPDAHLQLVGRDPSPEVRALAGRGVEVTGSVDEVRPWYARTRVAVAPLLAGGGSRLKILEALAAGRPVVATSIGAEGLEDLVGRGVVVEDEPQRLAAAVVALLDDPEGCAELGRRGADAVAADHSWPAAVRPLLAELAAARGNRDLDPAG